MRVYQKFGAVCEWLGNDTVRILPLGIQCVGVSYETFLDGEMDTPDELLNYDIRPKTVIEQFYGSSPAVDHVDGDDVVFSPYRRANKIEYLLGQYKMKESFKPYYKMLLTRYCDWTSTTHGLKFRVVNIKYNQTKIEWNIGYKETIKTTGIETIQVPRGLTLGSDDNIYAKRNIVESISAVDNRLKIRGYCSLCHKKIDCYLDSLTHSCKEKDIKIRDAFNLPITYTFAEYKGMTMATIKYRDIYTKIIALYKLKETNFVVKLPMLREHKDGKYFYKSSMVKDIYYSERLNKYVLVYESGGEEPLLI